VHDGQKCVNTKTKTTCTQTRTVLLSDSPLADVFLGGVATAPEPTASPEDAISSQVPVADPSVAPETAPLPEDNTKGTDSAAVTEETPGVAPDPTPSLEDGTKGIDQGAITEEPLAVDPGTEGGAPTTGKGGYVDVAVGDTSSLLAPADDEQQ
jgi:hypothetical protein